MESGPVFAQLHPRVAAWFAREVGEPTDVQRATFAAHADGRHVLVSSPTGTGKSLAALAPVLSDLHKASDSGELSDGIVCLYISPLRALNADVAHNLAKPIAEIAQAMRSEGEIPPEIRVGVRSGDTPPEERRRQSIAPPHVLVTTPETLAIILGSPRMRAALARVRHIVVDEIHALAGTRRGAHLALSLERVEERVLNAGAHAPWRMGLSATIADPARMAKYLAGSRDVQRVTAVARRIPELHVDACTDDLLTAPGETHEADLLARIHAIVQQNRTTLVFTNTRKGAERLVAGLRGAYPEYSHALASTDSLDPAFTAPDTSDGVAPHHGSMSREGRGIVEAQLKRGDLRCVIASSSLELGIDIGSVDHVVMVGSPRDPARALQRLGRAGHSLSAVSAATFLALDPDDALECLAIAHSVMRGDLAPLSGARPWLDVLAQHVVGIVLDRATHPGEIARLIRSSGPYAGLSSTEVGRVVEALAVERLVVIDAAGRIAAGPAASRMRYMQNVGTIAGSAKVRVRHGVRYVGEVDGIFADSLVAGDVFQLAGEPWMFTRCQGNALWAKPAPGEPLTLPVWLSEGLGAATPVTSTIAAIRDSTVNELQNQVRQSPPFPELQSTSECEGETKLWVGCHVTSQIESAVKRFIGLQRSWTGPWAPKECAVETFIDDDARRVTVFHLPVGRRVNETLGVAMRALQPPDDPLRIVVSDTGLATVTPRGQPPTHALFARVLASDIVALVEAAAISSQRFTRREREVANRFFLTRTSASRGPPAAMQARRGRHAAGDSPVRADALWDVLHDGWDLDGARAVVADFAAGAWTLGRLRKVTCASPFAFNILHRGESHPSRPRADALREAIERVQDGLAWRKQKEGGMAPHSLGG